MRLVAPWSEKNTNILSSGPEAMTLPEPIPSMAEELPNGLIRF